MKLYLVRHGEAMSKEEDPDRPLTDGGREAVSKVAAFLERSGAVVISEVRHSTKLRARQTAELMTRRLSGDLESKEVDELRPMADVEPLAEELATRGNDLMLVGHLPHLDRLASRLVAGDRDREAFDFEAGGTLCLERRDSGDGASWTVEWMLDPTLLSE